MNKEYIGKKQKYVLNKDTLKFAIFSLGQSHDEFYWMRPTSAGFVQFYKYKDCYSQDQLGVECFGNSESLGIASDSNYDSDIITRSLMEA